MRFGTIILAAALCATGCAASGVAADAVTSDRAKQEAPRVQTTMATRLAVGRPGFEKVEVLTRKSMPPQFDLVLVRQMPTPGYSFDVDAVDVDGDARRIVARVTERRPDGIVAQVMTDTNCRIPLGSVPPGPWVFELWLSRRGGPHEPAHAMVLTAR